MSKTKKRHYGSRWRCGKCHRIYEVDALLKLKRIEAVPGDPRYGNISCCSCGYVFHRDRWITHTTVHSKGFDIRVSTVYLEMSHNKWDVDEELWYETMLFCNESQMNVEGARCDYQDRYATKKEALADHNRIVKLLTEEKCRIVKNEGKNYIQIP